jgi:hypothetical protein
MNLLKLKIQIMTKISPKYFSDPESEINKQLSSYLFKYTYKLSGIPLCYKIFGIYPIGNIICDNEAVFLKTIVEMDILKFSINDYLQAENGVVFGVVYVRVDGNEGYSGRFKVLDVDNTSEQCSMIVGESS